MSCITHIRTWSKRHSIWLIRGGVVVLGCGLLYVLTITAPFSFPNDGTMIVIEDGDTLGAVSQRLAEENIIRMPAALEFFVITAGRERGVVAGPYAFSAREPVYRIANRVSSGAYGVEPTRVTLPEGIPRTEMASILATKLPRFSAQEFLTHTTKLEGYLFPDTYHILPTARAEGVADQMHRTFERKFTQPYEEEIAASPLSLDEIVTLASLVEREAYGAADARMIAGILLGRLQDGMRLQVDAPFFYLLGKSSAELTRTDLAIDSPYNTYKYAGLPPGPIGNPGLDALKAVINPIETDHRFYLHDSSGEAYYAETFSEHVTNKQRYLR